MSVILRKNWKCGIIFAIQLQMVLLAFHVFKVYNNAHVIRAHIPTCAALIFIIVTLGYPVVLIQTKRTKGSIREVYADVVSVSRFSIVFSLAAYISLAVLVAIFNYSDTDTMQTKYTHVDTYFVDENVSEDTQLLLSACPTWLCETVYVRVDTVYEIQKLLDSGVDIEDKKITLLLDNMDICKRNCKIQCICSLLFAFLFGVTFNYSLRTKAYIEWKKEHKYGSSEDK